VSAFRIIPEIYTHRVKCRIAWVRSLHTFINIIALRCIGAVYFITIFAAAVKSIENRSANLITRIGLTHIYYGAISTITYKKHFKIRPNLK